MIKQNKYYFIELLILSLPILIGNLGHTLIGFADIFVVAKYSIDALAAIGIANAILFTIFIFGLGILDAISIILSNKRGAKEKTKKYLYSSFAFSIFMAIIFTIICYSSKYFIDVMGFEAKLVPLIKQYIEIVSFSMFGMFIFQGIKQFLQAYEIVKFPNLLLLYAVVVNLILDFMFVLGYGPFPAMGSKGAAIATLLVRTLMGLVMFKAIFKSINFKSKIEYGYIKQIFKIGFPIGIALVLEFLAFNIITVLVGRETGTLAAVHNILVTISSATFMVPMSIAVALAVKVAYFYGAKKTEEIKKYSLVGFVLGVGFMAFASIILALFPTYVIKIFTSDKTVLDIAVPVVVIVSMYQIFDGFQVVAGGILKGFKLTKIVSICVTSCYWLVGCPIAYILISKYNMSLKGYWIALAVSLFVMGISQVLIAFVQYKKIKMSEKIL